MRNFSRLVWFVSPLVYIIAASNFLLPACDDSGSTGGCGDEGGGCGEELTTGPSSSSSSSASTTASSSTTGPAMCDNAGVCGDATNASSCIGCALEGDCADELATCQGDQECIDFVMCIDPCADQACFDACVTMYPNGATLYNDLVFCAICEQCPVACDGPGSGCP